MADTVLRQELRDALERVEGKVDQLDEKVESKLDRLDERMGQAIEKRVSKDEYSVTIAALEKRIERLENMPQRLWVIAGVGIAMLSVTIAAFWILVWVIEHAHP